MLLKSGKLIGICLIFNFSVHTSFGQNWKQATSLESRLDFLVGDSDSTRLSNEETTNFQIREIENTQQNDQDDVIPSDYLRHKSSLLRDSFEKVYHQQQQLTRRSYGGDVIHSDDVLGFTPKIRGHRRKISNTTIPYSEAGNHVNELQRKEGNEEIHTNDVTFPSATGNINGLAPSNLKKEMNNEIVGPIIGTSESRYKARIHSKHNARHGYKLSSGKKTRKILESHPREHLENIAVYINISDPRLDHLIGEVNSSLDYELQSEPASEIWPLDDFKYQESFLLNESRLQSGQYPTESRRPYFNFGKYVGNSQFSEESFLSQKASGLSSTVNGTLRCYTCDDSFGDHCYNISSLNETVDRTLIPSKSCESEEESCMVSRVWFVTKTSESNKTEHQFSITRKCEKECKPYCIMMGDRREIEIFACTSCCNEDNCNTGNGSMSIIKPASFWLLPVITLLRHEISF